MQEELKTPSITETEPVGQIFADLTVEAYNKTQLELEAIRSTDS